MSGPVVYVIQHYEPKKIDSWMYREFTTEELERFKDPGPTGWHKIGVAENVERRLSSLRGGTPHELRLITTIDVDGDAQQVERELHELYRGPRDRGEWFKLPIDHVEHLKKIDLLRPGVIKDITEYCTEIGDLSSVPQPSEVNLFEEVRDRL